MKRAFDPAALTGQVTFVTGPEKNCGKTSFLLAALAAWRQARAEAGRSWPLALLTVGYDGEVRDWLSGQRKPGAPLQVGDYYITVERFLRAGGCCPEIVALVPGSGALGRCCIARATRPGLAALVGPEGNAGLGAAIAWLRAELAGCTILVDGAINRITQLAAVPDARLAYVLRLDRAGLNRAVERLQRLALLLQLPAAPAGETALALEAAADQAGAAIADQASADPALYSLADALTSESLQRLPAACRRLVVEDFTKIFLTAAELRAGLAGRQLYSRAAIECVALVAVTRGVDDDEVARRLPDPFIQQRLLFNPYRLAEPLTGDR
ncbi:MAG: hypothetical protein A2087_13165 [Spirochaetes bacterium GWD1_61_31]|nr:MAG: hypothetical protein A2Y37_02570 [Spirochaetes bacterium GWB1_60_80]OHD28589.1 MAG: hypothetical protein A2004_03145 [Spirochaetes bacterium GWC1_61_12]OHD39446.1 MAG: hypothetical protein A2087_13165 [Spirochaetes bacterium GWD1_61_31]OHD45499.1 MAG: hypothetical protein A2Y35_02840 [Spirochaetes bacterium GWE1_60_18]OHD58073.1 MAG: hypothetical protein A2Y32_05415 [Spirochaetes bacterium GWF1_60_12]HAP44640.1 hypothetical protein [Spirochaetaceae bacterium]